MISKLRCYQEAILSSPIFLPDGDCLTLASTTVPVSEEAVLVLTSSSSSSSSLTTLAPQSPLVAGPGTSCSQSVAIGQV